MNPILIYEISEKCDFYTKIKINCLNSYIYGLVRITELPCRLESIIENENLKNLYNLQTLNLRYNQNITDEGIKNLSNLQRLDLGWNKNITGECKNSLRERGCKVYH